MIKGIRLTSIKMFEVRRSRKRGEVHPGSYLGRVSCYNARWYAETATGDCFNPSRTKKEAVQRIVDFWDDDWAARCTARQPGGQTSTAPHKVLGGGG